jgi:hypothetical protein
MDSQAGMAELADAADFRLERIKFRRSGNIHVRPNNRLLGGSQELGLFGVASFRDRN